MKEHIINNTGSDEYIEGIARNMKAGWLAVHMGISLSYAFKRYVKDKEISEIWLQLAKITEDIMQENMTNNFKELMKTVGTKTV